jgi:hypothetical protein
MELQDAKLKLEQKKHRLAAEEIRLKLKERKMRTRKLIEIGGLAAKSEIDFLTTTQLFGAFLFLCFSCCFCLKNFCLKNFHEFKRKNDNFFFKIFLENKMYLSIQEFILN